MCSRHCHSFTHMQHWNRRSLNHPHTQQTNLQLHKIANNAVHAVHTTGIDPSQTNGLPSQGVRVDSQPESMAHKGAELVT